MGGMAVSEGGKHPRQRQAGFTMLELLIVMFLFGIFMSWAYQTNLRDLADGYRIEGSVGQAREIAAEANRGLHQQMEITAVSSRAGDESHIQRDWPLSFGGDNCLSVSEAHDLGLLAESRADGAEENAFDEPYRVCRGGGRGDRVFVEMRLPEGSISEALNTGIVITDADGTWETIRVWPREREASGGGRNSEAGRFEALHWHDEEVRW